LPTPTALFRTLLLLNFGYYATPYYYSTPYSERGGKERKKEDRKAKID